MYPIFNLLCIQSEEQLPQSQSIHLGRRIGWISLLKSYVESVLDLYTFVPFWSHFNNIVSNTYFILISHSSLAACVKSYRFQYFCKLLFISEFTLIISYPIPTSPFSSFPNWVWINSTLHPNNHDNAKVIHLVNDRHRIFPREFHGLFEVLCDIIVELDVGFYKCPFWSHILNRLWVCFVYFCSLLKPLIEFNTNFILLLMSLDVHRNNPLLNLLKLNFLIESQTYSIPLLMSLCASEQSPQCQSNPFRKQASDMG